MYRPLWASTTLSVNDLEAAKKDHRIVCPNSALGTEGSDQVSISIPLYQRGLVWKVAHGRRFQDALRDGWPIGQLVLAEKPSESLSGGALLRHYELIDGQQRTHWLNMTRDNFFRDARYSLEGASLSQALNGLAAAFGVDGEAKLSASVRKWTRSHKFLMAHLRDNNYLMHHLVSDLEVLPLQMGTSDYEQASAHIITVNTALADQYESLKGLPVPVLVIRQALQTQLHEIFQRLNSGTRLSDLDLIAAEWRLIAADISTSTLLPEKVKNDLIGLAQTRISDTYESDEYEYIPELVELTTANISLFDLLYALGRYAAAQHRVLFEAVGQNADRLAIFVAALVFSGGIGRRGDLSDTYPDSGSSTSRDVTFFPNQFILACRDLNDALQKVNGVGAGKRLRGRVGLIQAATYLASHIVLVGHVKTGAVKRLSLNTRQTNDDQRLHNDPTVRLTTTQRREAFKRHVVGWHLHDSLSAVFQGSDAYTDAAGRVWDVFDREQGQYRPNETMLGAVGLESLTSQFRSRFLKELRVVQTPKQRRYSDAGSALLRCAYASLPTSMSSEELDHVLPFTERNGRSFAVAINHPANLMPLRPAINRARRDRLFPDYLSLPTTTDEYKQEIEKRLLIPAVGTGSGAFTTQTRYEAFLENRYRELVRRAMDSVDHPGLESTDLATANYAAGLLLGAVANQLDSGDVESDLEEPLEVSLLG